MASPDIDASLAERLGGRWLISWQASVITIPLALAVLALSVQASEHVLTWLMIAVISVAVGGVSTYVMHRTAFRDRALRPVAIPWVIGTTMFIGLLYVGSAVILGLLLGVLDVTDAAFQFVPLYVVVVSWGLLLTLVLDSQWRFRVQREELIHQAVQLQLASAQELDVLQDIRDSVHSEVGEHVKTSSAGLIRRIDDLIEAGQADAGVLPRELRHAADQTVRPLSHELEERARCKHRTPGFLTALANIVRYQPFRPVAVSIFVALTALPRDINVLGWTFGFGLLLVTVAFIFAIMSPLNQAMDRWPQHHASLYLVGLVLIQAPTVLLSPIREQVTGETITASQLIVTAVFGTIVVLATSSYGSWNRTRKEVIADFQREVDGDTIAALARGEALAKATMDAALMLHGSVQSSLYACALMIEEASRRRDMVAVNQALMQARAILEQPDLERGARDSVSLSEAVSQPITQWAGLLAVDVDIDSLAEELAAGRSAHVADIVEEAIANAVHHGSASQVSVRIGASDQELVVSVQDNGAGPGGGSPGLGSRLYSRFGGQWSLTPVDSGTVLSLQLPLVETASQT